MSDEYGPNRVGHKDTNIQYGFTISCGVREYRGVQFEAPKVILKNIEKHKDNHKFTFVTFSDTTTRCDGTPDPYPKKHSGTEFAKFVKDKNLGKIWETDDLPNRAHGPCNIKVWVYAPDWVALKKFNQGTSHD